MKVLRFSSSVGPRVKQRLATVFQAKLPQLQTSTFKYCYLAIALTRSQLSDFMLWRLIYLEHLSFDSVRLSEVSSCASNNDVGN